MILRATLLVLLAVPVVARAQGPAPTGPGGETAVAASSATAAAARQWAAVDHPVAVAVAARWGIEPAAVRLDWGGREPLPAGKPVSLLGTGAGGSFVAEYHDGQRLVRQRIRAAAVVRVSVAARDLERGETLTAAHVVEQDTMVWGGPAMNAGVAAGWVARRRIPAGSVLAPPAVGPPAAVTAGESVVLVWRGTGLEVKTGATAAGTAVLGERVAVRTDSGQRLWGVVEAPGTVRIGGGE